LNFEGLIINCAAALHNFANLRRVPVPGDEAGNNSEDDDDDDIDPNVPMPNAPIGPRNWLELGKRVRRDFIRVHILKCDSIRNMSILYFTKCIFTK
jgi:hypothetical protein